MSTTAAQDEFNELFRDKNRISRHRDDSDSDDFDHEADTESLNEKDDDVDSDYDDYDRAEDRINDAMRSKYYLPSNRSEANTGPKGVIADAQAFEQAKKSQRFSLFRGGSNGPMPKPRGFMEGRIDEKTPSRSASDEDDDTFMSRWRESRLKQLQHTPKNMLNRSTSRSRTDSPSSRGYGKLMAVDADGYLETVDNSSPSTTVVVFIYDDRSEISNMVEECLRTLARRHGMVRFIKFHYKDAEMNVAGVPAVLAYRGGEKFAGLVPVMDEIPDDAELSDVSLEVALKRHQILF
ncbi:thioredoxin-like protein [Saccharata proteae CBS 121410]|uniref:Thioredoxin-like protein n=1 Tax=Saccharata proteae CBS 121410 TaxID=1314787 RepID=A0A9P4M0J5_9PEZI|nr:thioredoxin-like protein [Saccharata proteae CBS 121410]